MSVTRKMVEQALRHITLPGGGDPVSRDMVRALSIEGGAEGDVVRFVLEAPSVDAARGMETLRAAAEQAVAQIDGVEAVSVALTAHGPDKGTEAPTIGQHPQPQKGPIKPEGVARILAVASGKGGVGKSTVSANLAVALARQGRRVGLLDADIYGPSQARMMGATARPASPDGQSIIPLRLHGVTMMSIGLLVEEDKAIVWRGPMLMGALQQLIGQVQWGELDDLIIDLPPGTGDVQLTLCQKTELSGALIVSTPQDVALLDARKAIDMFRTLGTPVLGLIENMSTFHCPQCGAETQIFGHGGVAAEAERMGAPLLAALPIDLDTRLAGDAGTPVAAGDGAVAEAYAALAARLVADGIA